MVTGMNILIYADARDWNLSYKAAFKGIRGSELGACTIGS